MKKKRKTKMTPVHQSIPSHPTAQLGTSSLVVRLSLDPERSLSDNGQHLSTFIAEKTV